ncbi:hypothetical protein D3C86_1698720 [compost metagenome]
MDKDKRDGPECGFPLQVLDLVLVDIVEGEARCDLGLLGFEVDPEAASSRSEVAEEVGAALLLREDLAMGPLGPTVVPDDRPSGLRLLDVGQALEAVLLVDGLDRRLETAAAVRMAHAPTSRFWRASSSTCARSASHRPFSRLTRTTPTSRSQVISSRPTPRILRASFLV